MSPCQIRMQAGALEPRIPEHVDTLHDVVTGTGCGVLLSGILPCGPFLAGPRPCH